MKQYRKEGNIILFSIFYFLFISLLVAVFISLLFMSETYKRVQDAAEGGAKTRALAVNMPLKEEFGLVETFRKDKSEGYAVNYTEPTYSNSPTPGFDQAILSPLSIKYKSAIGNADLAAKQAVISKISSSIGKNEADDGIVNLKNESICIQILPLPKGDVITKRAKLDFACTATTSSGVQKEIVANGMEVYGTEHPLNKKDNVEVKNIVFVGVAYEDKHVFYNLFQRLTNGTDQSNWSKPPIRTTYGIAYPQVDSCSVGEC